jgi:hypothetical protein
MIAAIENSIAARPAATAPTTGERPLMTVGAAAFVLSWRQARVEYWVENGKLPSFDIRLETAQRTSLRLFAAAVIAAKHDVGFIPKLSAAQMIEAIFPVRQATFSQSEVSWRLHCSCEHVVHLVESRALSEGGLRGCQGSRSISRASLAKFLSDGGSLEPFSQNCISL